MAKKVKLTTDQYSDIQIALAYLVTSADMAMGFHKHDCWVTASLRGAYGVFGIDITEAASIAYDGGVSGV